jgi:hypothetical protein
VSSDRARPFWRRPAIVALVVILLLVLVVIPLLASNTLEPG